MEIFVKYHIFQEHDKIVKRVSFMNQGDILAMLCSVWTKDAKNTEYNPDKLKLYHLGFDQDNRPSFSQVFE
jgi:hypothetical protein